MSLRTSTPSKSSKIKIAVSGLALAAAASGAVSAWPSSPAAQQAVAASQAPLTTPAASLTLGASTGVTGTSQAQLDAFSVAATTQTTRRLTPRQIAWRMLWRFHWRHWQFRWLNKLWSRESSWNVHASNPYSGAYGIPQAVPGSKMSTAGPNWTTSAWTQIRWGMRYIRATYGGPKHAWQHELADGWY